MSLLAFNMDIDYIPQTLEETQEFLDRYLQDKDTFKNYQEKDVMDIANMTLGRWIVNKWYLWWNEKDYDQLKGKNTKCPDKKPELVKFFNDLEIYDFKEMSEIIIISYHRKLNNKSTIDFEYIKDHFNKVQEYYTNKKQ